MKKQIAFIGSSGGNLYKQGGNDIAGMMKEILAQTKAADMEIAFVQYVLASGSLDTVGPESKASLYTWDGAAVCKTFEGTLQQVNEKAAEWMLLWQKRLGRVRSMALCLSVPTRREPMQRQCRRRQQRSFRWPVPGEPVWR